MVGKTKIIPNVVIDKIQAYPIPTSVKHLQIFLGLLGYWRVFVPYLAQVVHPFYALVKKGSKVGLDPNFGTSVPRSKAHP